MIKTIILAFGLVSLACLVREHNSHSLPISAQMKQKIIEANVGRDLPVVWSYHIHCVFVLGEKDTVIAALDLRQQFIAQFNLTNVPQCKSTFDDVRLCMFGI